MKKITVLIAIFMIFTLVFVSCDAPVNSADDADDSLQNEENIGDDTHSSDNDTDGENNTDNENKTDDGNETSYDNSSSNDNEDSNENSSSNDGESSDESSSSNEGGSSSQGGSNQGGSNQGSSSNDPETSDEEWIEPTVELQEPITVGDYELALNVEGTEYTIVKYTGEDENLTVISEHEGIPVTRIGDRAFESSYYLKNISIPAPIRTIGDEAFNYCYGITSINIAESVVFIGKDVFRSCEDLISFVIKDENPRYHSAGNCLIETATKTLIKGFNSSVIPNDDSVEIIATDAFYSMDNLKAIAIPRSVKTIESRAFYVCPALESITVDSENPFYSASGNCLIHTQSKTLILGSNNSVIPTDGSVEVIDGLSFYDCTKLKAIHIPASVTRIGYAPFINCVSIESFTVEKGNPIYHSEGNCIIETATKTLVGGCKASVIPDDGSVTTIGQSSFYSIGNGAYVDFTKIEIPGSVEVIDENAFMACAYLTDVVLHEGVAEIRTDAFYCCSLSSITIPASVTYIGADVFWGSNDLTIYYKGTEEQWNAINKADTWDQGKENITVLFNQ